MRKLVVVLLCCLVVLGCNKKREQEAAEDELIANATMPQVGTAPDTAPPVATDSVATTTASSTTDTPVAIPAPSGFPVYSATDTVDVFAPPKPPEYDYLVDTFYDWPNNIIGWVQKEAPGLDEFQMKNKNQIIARRAREGYEPTRNFTVLAMQTRPTHPLFSFKKTIVIYRKPKAS